MRVKEISILLAVILLCGCSKKDSLSSGIVCTMGFSLSDDFLPSITTGDEGCLIQYSDLRTVTTSAKVATVSDKSAVFNFNPSEAPKGSIARYTAVYPSSAMPTSSSLSIPKKQEVTSGSISKESLVYLSSTMTFSSMPSSIGAKMSSVGGILKLNFTNLSQSSISGMTLSATASSKAVAICGGAEIDPEEGGLYSYGYTGSLEISCTGNSTKVPAVCYPYTLSGGDYLDIDLSAGGETFCIRTVVKPGKTLVVGSGEITEVEVDMTGVQAGKERKEITITPSTSDPKDKEHPYICLNTSGLAALKAAISTQGGSSPVGKIHNIIMSNADKSISAADLTYSKPDGKRLLAMSRTAELQIISCAYAYRYTGSGKYLTRAVKDLKAVCGFQDWNCKTHSLDAGEMAVGVGIGYDWLYDYLSEDERTLCEKALYNFALTPFINAFGSGSYKKGYTSQNFLTSESNWNQVCCAGMVVAALALKDKYPDVQTKVVSLCVDANKKIVKTMYDGGTYPEGYGYWSYGTDYQVVMNSALESVLGTDYGIYDIAGLPTSARFFLYMESQFGSSFGYSDGNSNWAAGLPMWYFAYKSGNSDILYDEVRKLSGSIYSSSDDLRLIPLLMSYVAGVDLQSPTPPSEKVFAEGTTQPLVVVKTGWAADANTEYLGIKGGKASTSHGHMDAGSFVFDSQGLRWARDYGGGSYAPFEAAATAAGKSYWNMTQSSFRWTVGIVNNRTHNTITVNDSDYNVNALVALNKIQTSTEMGASMDLTDALNGQVAKATRTVKLVNEEDLYVIDEITALSSKDAKVDWRMLTPASYTVGSDNILLSKNSKSLYIRTQTTVPVTYKHFDSVINTYDVNLDNAGYHLVGFTATVPKGQSVTFTTKLSKQ